jgi:small neutral amino acid transporter SnatA (MarC family)
MWKHNPKLVARKVAGGILVTSLVVAMLYRKSKKTENFKE